MKNNSQQSEGVDVDFGTRDLGGCHLASQVESDIELSKQLIPHMDNNCCKGQTSYVYDEN